ncbi:MAG: choice-of-anchor D domain-containing protein, partial [Cytophagales bacterium]|nr:choice-of-anchor D domain-containing protein [Cytophagales bacterium]
MKKYLLLNLFLLFLFQKEIMAASCTWNGSVSTVWENTANWNDCGGSLPGTGDIVYMYGGTPFEPTLSSTQTILTLQMSGGAVLTVEASGNLTITGENSFYYFYEMNIGGTTTINYGTITVQKTNGNAAIGGIYWHKTSRFRNFGTFIFNTTGGLAMGVDHFGSTGITEFTNNPGAIFHQKGGGLNLNSNVTGLNEGLMLLSSFSFSNLTNGGIVRCNTTHNSLINNTQLIINNSPEPIFVYGGSYNMTINGIFSNSAGTISAGTFNAPNTFTPLNSLPNGTQTLYAKVTKGGNIYIVPFEYNKIASPEINLKGNATNIASGDITPTTTDHTDFGSQNVNSGTIIRTFTVENTGTGSLTLSGSPKVTLSGTNAADFTVNAQPSSPVSPSGSTTFQVTFDPSNSGIRTASISISNDDADENPYTFSIQGTGTCTATATATDQMNWNGSVNNDWANPCNWTPNGIPTASNPIAFNTFVNEPIIYNGTAAVGEYFEMIASNFNLTIESGASLTLGGRVGNAAAIYLRNNNVEINNFGTINISKTRNTILSEGVRSSGIHNVVNNYGILNTDLSTSNGSVFKLEDSANDSLKVINSGTINVLAGSNLFVNSYTQNDGIINFNGGNHIVFLETGQVFKNSGTVYGNITNANRGFWVNSGATIVNQNCGKIFMNSTFFSEGTVSNQGLLLTPDLQISSGTFSNNGVLKYGSLSGSIVNTTNSSIIVNNSPIPIFTYGGTYNGTVNGIFTDVLATTLAGTFTAPNTFTPNVSLPSGNRTLYAKIMPSGGACSYVIPFTYINCPASPTISYSGSPYCSSASPAAVSLTGTSGGAFTSSPAGLTLNSSTGQSTPSSSTAGVYTVTYTIAASGGCSSAVATTSVTITDNPSAAISYSGSPYCSSASPAAVSLTGTSGGAFTSSPAGLTLNSSTGQITPSSSTAGVYTVTYTIAASGGCSSAVATTSVTITDNPSASISYSGSPYCSSASPAAVSLTGTSGGAFTSSPAGLTLNSSTGQITPSSSTAGVYTVTYTIAASGGCSSAVATTSVTITDNPSASISYSGSPYCSSASPAAVSLTGTSGGAFTSSPAGLTLNSSTGQITPSS